MLGKPRHVAAHHTGIHAELRLHELRAGVDLGLQAFRLPAGRRVDRIVGAAEEKIGAAGDLAAGRQFAGIAQAARGLQQRARVEIEHRLGVGLIAGARIVAAQHQQIAHAAGGGAQQIALQGDAVAVAAGELQHRLDAVLDQQRGRRHRAEMRPRAGAVGDVDRVGEALERRRLGQQFAAVGADTGGVTSAVITKRRAASLSCRVICSVLP